MGAAHAAGAAQRELFLQNQRETSAGLGKTLEAPSAISEPQCRLHTAHRKDCQRIESLTQELARPDGCSGIIFAILAYDS
jgi:hypothetical protein